MVTLLRSTALSVALLAGLAATADAQLVSALPNGSPPPSYGETLPPQNAHTGIAGSTQSVYPKPGGGGLWTEDHSQLSGQAVTGTYPYANGAGPKPTS
jgi:hypothetical protein